MPREIPLVPTIDYGYSEMISTAQNWEDVLIFRAFRGRTHGYYVDLGAGDPNWDSVTNWLYRVGWRGINVEPNPDIFRTLRLWRPHDTNLNIACSDEPGYIEFHQVHADTVGHGWGLSTVDLEGATRAHDLGYRVTDSRVMARPLAKVLDQYAIGKTIDVLKIDVEGHEAAILRSGDWRRHRPSIVVVEAVAPMSAVPTLHRWAPILLGADYAFMLFDGVNGWFLANEAPPDLRNQLMAPVNCNDHFRKATSTDFVLPE